MVKTFEPVVHQKFRWLVTSLSNYCHIGIRTIQTLSEMPAEVLQQMIGKTVLISEKKQMVLTTIQ
jgi:hypothetical protein